MRASTIKRVRKPIENKVETAMASKAANKQKQTSKYVQLVRPSYMVDSTKSNNLKGAAKLRFQTLVAQVKRKKERKEKR